MTDTKAFLSQFSEAQAVGSFDVVAGNVRNQIVHYDTALPDGHYKLYTHPAPAATGIQRAMKRLAELLDEDQFAEIEAIVTQAGYAPAPAPVAADYTPMSDEKAKQLLEASELLEMLQYVGWYSAPRKSFDKYGLVLIRQVEAALRG